jgi:hypothetical protein
MHGWGYRRVCLTALMGNFRLEACHELGKGTQGYAQELVGYSKCYRSREISLPLTTLMELGIAYRLVQDLRPKLSFGLIMPSIC